jgi:hypothetical protein
MYFAFLGHVSNELERIFPGDQRQMMLGQYHLVDSVVDELSTVFLADLPDLVTWRGQKKNMCVYGHPTDPIFQPPTLTFFIGNYSTQFLLVTLSIFTQNSDNHFVV